MAEFLTMQEAEDKFGKKGRTNAALTLGIIGTALGAFTGNNGCGCGNNGILGGLFGGNNGNCIAEKAMQTAMAQGQMSQNLAWNNRVQSMQDDIDLYTYINGRNLATIRKSKEYIQSQIKAKEEKVNTLLELMESDPEMKKRFDELMMNKTAK